MQKAINKNNNNFGFLLLDAINPAVVRYKIPPDMGSHNARKLGIQKPIIPTKYTTQNRNMMSCCTDSFFPNILIIQPPIYSIFYTVIY